MRYVAAASAVALGLGLAGTAQAQTPVQPTPPPVGVAPADTPPAEVTPGDRPAAPLAGSAADEEAAEADTGHAKGDPFEKWNRGVYKFNDSIDQAIVEPLAKGYRAVTPGFFRSGVRNFLHNLASPVILANDVLQAEPKRAGATTGRFVINTTIGLLGLFDVGEKVGLKKHDEDFGQTLGKWGVGPGPYLMLPLLGPSNMRDLTGKVVDYAIDPITYAKFKHDDEARLARTGMDLLTQRTDTLDAVDSLRETSVDPYAAARSFYDQSRESAILNGQEGAEDSPESEGNLSE